MIELKSIYGFEIKGRPAGSYFMVQSPREMDRENVDIIGQTVSVDGQKIKVSGVKCADRPDKIRSGEMIALLIDWSFA